MHDPEYLKNWESLLNDLGLEQPATTEPPQPLPQPSPEAEQQSQAVIEEAPAPVSEEPTAGRGRRRRSTPVEEVEPNTTEPTEEPVKEVRGRRRRRGKAVEEETPAVVETAEQTTLPEASPVSETPPPLPVEVLVETAVAESETAEPATVADVSTEDGEDTEPERRRRRRRRRGRKPAVEAEAVAEEDDDSEEAAAEEEVVSEEVEEATEQEEEDDEEFEDLTDLAVPSWAELVASLYRPPDR